MIITDSMLSTTVSTAPECIDTLLTLPVWSDSWELFHVLRTAVLDLDRIVAGGLPAGPELTRRYVLLYLAAFDTEDAWAEAEPGNRCSVYVTVLTWATNIAEHAFDRGLIGGAA